jgi:hypothetical protein
LTSPIRLRAFVKTPYEPIAAEWPRTTWLQRASLCSRWPTRTQDGVTTRSEGTRAQPTLWSSWRRSSAPVTRGLGSTTRLHCQMNHKPVTEVWTFFVQLGRPPDALRSAIAFDGDQAVPSPGRSCRISAGTQGHSVALTVSPLRFGSSEGLPGALQHVDPAPSRSLPSPPAGTETPVSPRSVSFRSPTPGWGMRSHGGGRTCRSSRKNCGGRSNDMNEHLSQVGPPPATSRASEG